MRLVFSTQLLQQRPSRSGVSLVERAQEQLERLQHLLRQPRRHLALVSARVAEDRGEPLLEGHHEDALRVEQHHQSAHQRTTRELTQRIEREGEVPRTLAVRSVHQSQRAPVGEQPDGHLRLPQKPLEASLHRRVPALGLRRQRVEIDAVGHLKNVHQALALGHHDPVALQRLAILLEIDAISILGRAEIARLPAEELDQEVLHVFDDALLTDDRFELLLLERDVLVGHHSGLHQRGRRDHQAHRLREADPLEMKPQFVVRHRPYPVTGQR